MERTAQQGVFNRVDTEFNEAPVRQKLDLAKDLSAIADTGRDSSGMQLPFLQN